MQTRSLLCLVLWSAAACTEPRDEERDAATRDAQVVDASRRDSGNRDSGNRDSGRDDNGELCAEQTNERLPSGDEVVVCIRAHDRAPFVRPPADYDADGARFVYGGVARDATNQLSFIGRGVSFPLTDDPAWLAAEAQPNAVRYAYFLYRARVVDERVADVTPIARIDDRVFQRFVAGTVFEGHVARREVDENGNDRFTHEDLSLPIRVRFDATPREVESDRIAGFPRFAVDGTIENADSALRAADGSCMPSLASHGSANPLTRAADARITVLRHPAMHGFYDDVSTFDWPPGVSIANNMGGGLFVSVAALMAAEYAGPTEYSSHPHGVPWGGPANHLHRVLGGGESCE